MGRVPQVRGKKLSTEPSFSERRAEVWTLVSEEGGLRSGLLCLREEG